MAAEVLPLHLGVKNLVDSGLDKLPGIYIRSKEERPNAVHREESFPVLDLGAALNSSEARAALVPQIREACVKWGFFQVINHGVPHSLVDEMQSVAREFHALPNEEKMRYFSTDTESRMRYGTSFNVTQDKVFSWRDYLRHSCLPLAEMQELWPEKPASYREVTADYSTRVRNLAKFLLELISESLDLPKDYIDKAFNGCSQIMALNFYPACPEPDLVLGIGPHSDPGSITLLLQDHVEGLQVMHANEWYSVKPIPYSFVVNLGEQIQILSNDKYKSAEHRAVVNSSEDRMSIPVAMGPNWESLVHPASKLVEGSPVFKPMVYKDYMTALQAGGLNRQWLLDTLRI
ncbi:2-oxoacid-dependent dioxygenase [Selaginella moellendorffii]|uniref:2-oxoacid-dependent dioxygenase n=1 Tax=Selaginella moellendorffii TaxID=88036 RepID=D8R3W7_SELML|nr:protein DMR6-LIKE OXYGENASE 1 [Selaginella moellendorffii]EFJ33360.1 2-oxoacid-dependent dioxygenase [Selaginella moellendorffii]|eukprot:XP_002965940.1 protein DMR6-LIKE OXYGENASE 1 [Selaginella moellendorffii]